MQATIGEKGLTSWNTFDADLLTLTPPSEAGEPVIRYRLEPSLRSLIAAILRQAVEDASGQTYFARGKTRPRERTEEEQRDASQFLHSDDAVLYAMALGIPVSKYLATLRTLAGTPDPPPPHY